MKTGTLNRNQLKYIAIIAMLIDHIAWTFIPTATATAQIMHFIGRLTGPTMAFFLAEGYEHTGNKQKYGIRLALFAFISWPCFSFLKTGSPLSIRPGVIYTLFLGFLTIYIWDQTGVSKFWKTVATITLCVFSLIGDWGIFDVILPLTLWSYRNNEKKKWTAFLVICVCAIVYYTDFAAPLWQSVYTLGILMTWFVLKYGYNGQPGRKTPFNKWIFYAFYPAHLMLLGIIRWCL